MGRPCASLGRQKQGDPKGRESDQPGGFPAIQAKEHRPKRKDGETAPATSRQVSDLDRMGRPCASLGRQKQGDPKGRESDQPGGFPAIQAKEHRPKRKDGETAPATSRQVSDLDRMGRPCASLGRQKQGDPKGRESDQPGGFPAIQAKEHRPKRKDGETAPATSRQVSDLDRMSRA